MVALMVAQSFGTEKIGSMLGCFMPSIALGGFPAPWFAGSAFDRWGSYDLTIVAAASLSVLAAIVVMKMPAKPYAEVAFLR